MCYFQDCTCCLQESTCTLLLLPSVEYVSLPSEEYALSSAEYVLLSSEEYALLLTEVGGGLVFRR